jgi:hypothetical protein
MPVGSFFVPGSVGLDQNVVCLVCLADPLAHSPAYPPTHSRAFLRNVQA